MQVFAIAFWIWNVIFGGWTLLELGSAVKDISVGVGTSAYVSMIAEVWIAGCVFLALSTFMARIKIGPADAA